MARTLDQLAIIANQIKDATLQGENTADRVGGLLVDLIDFLRTINVDEITLSPLLTALNESGLVDPQDGQILRFKSSEDNWVFSSDITQITSTIRTIIDTLGQLDNRFVKKTGDIMTGLLTTLAGIKVRNFLQLGDRFVSGLLGEGAIFRENIGGRTYLEADEIYIRVKAYFDTVEIRKFLHSGGNRIASLGGAKCVRVEMLNSNNEVVTQNPAKYRCYFRASDGDDTITNDFVVGDQAYCHVTNATNSSLSMHHYWRLVIGKNELPNENGEHWIDLSNQESETIDGIVYSGYLNISDAPAAQDDIIQLGNVNDSTRRGAIIEFVSGNDAPAYQIFQDLGSIGSATTIAQKHDAQYSYNGKNYISMGYNSSTGRAFMNVYGDFLFGDPEESTYVKYNAFTKQLDIKATVRFISPTTHQETTLDTFASVVTGGLESLQRQIDGEIDTWFYNGTPGPSVLPESEWVAIDTQTGTNNERLKHLGDLYYDNSTGYAYRYSNTGSEASPIFTWSQISDSAVIKALEGAAKAQDTADHKRRVFVTSAGVLPTPPYSEGDLWMNVTYPANATMTDAANNIYYNDILRCKVPATYNQQGELVREGVETGETALITHWQLSSKYTDDSKFNYFFTNTYSPFVTSIQQQVDRKAETYRQAANPASSWADADKPKHVGDLWMDTSVNGGNKTYIYQNTGTEDNPNYQWVAQAVPEEVFDKIDGKAAIYVGWEDWIVDGVNQLQDKDLYVPNTDHNPYKANKVYRWRASDSTWNEIKYTDDTTVNNFISGTYATFVSNIQEQVDKKAETWRQSTDPSLAQGWVASSHVGDIWMDTDQNNGHNTYIYVSNGGGTYGWEPQAVPDEVFDEIDGKAEIFVQKPTTYHERDMWIIESSTTTCPDADIPANCKRGDIVVASSDSNSYNKTHWTKKDRYTDDTIANSALTAITNLSNDPHIQDLIGGGINQAITDGDDAAVQQAAQAAQTTYGYLTQALNKDTVIDGGLVLTSLIALRDANSNVWSGISGTYIDRTTPNPEDPSEPYAKGHGIAAWYGGENIDHEAFPALTNYAKSLFRFDGSGYLASGNITWDDSGNLTVQGQAIKATTYYLNGQNITDALNAVLTMFTLEGAGTTANPYVIKANFGLYSVGGITALGQGSQGGGGGGSTTLYGLNDVSKNAAGDGVLGAENGYVLTYNGATNHWYAAPTPETYVLPTATASALGGIKIGYTTSGKNYAVQLANGQAYVNVPWTDTTYSLPLAANGTRGGIQLGYTQSGKNYPVQLSGEKAYVNVPWENTTYTLAGLMGSSAKGSTTQPIYWNGSAFANTSYTLGKSVPSDAKFTDTTYSNGTGLALSGTTFSINSTYQTYISHGESAYGYFTNGVANNSACLLAVGTIQDQDALDGFHEGRKLKYGIWNGFTPTGLYSNGLIIDGGYTSADYGFQIAIDDDPTYKIHLRQKNTSGWADWKQIPMGDGTGASGTWGINITGSAGSVAWSNVTSKPSAAGDATTPVYWTGSGFTACTAYANASVSHATTASRLASTTIPENANLNDYKTTGVYGQTDGHTIGSFTNRPNAYSAGEMRLEVIGCHNSTSYLFQKYWARAGNSWDLYIRTYTGSAWTDWAKNIDSRNIGSQSVSYATTSGSCSGNSASASKLTTVSKTAWGQTFWTSDGVPTSISGALSSVTNITMSGYIKIGDAYLSYDSTNNAIRVSKNADGTGAANFYAIGGVSALGASEGGGGGGQGDVTWALLANNSDERPIALSHIADALTDYATKSWVSTNFALKSDIPTLATLSWSGYSSGSYNGSEAKTISIPSNTNQLTNGAGFVTSSGVTSVATGTGLTGGTITSTGTISINSTYQTYISNGNTAYGWGNHANAGYITSSGSCAKASEASYLLTNNTSQAADDCYDEHAGLRFWRYNGTSSTTGQTGGDGWILSWSWGEGSVGGQIYLDDNPSKTICIRGRNNDSAKTFTTWSTVLHTGNSSVSKSGETLTVNIGGTSQSLTNTWRGITDSYSGTSSDVSLSQKGGNALYNALVNGYASSAGNADTLDNVHLNGIFTSLENESNQLSVTLGGVNKKLTVGYASKSTYISTAENLDTAEKADAFHQGNTLKIGILSGSGVPSGSSDGIVLAVGIGNDYGHQIHLDDNRNEMYHRSMVGEGKTWNSWLKIIDSGNIGSQSVNYATTAGTATNLANNPSIQAGTSNTDKVTITAGGKTSSEFVIPYATRSYRFYSGDANTGAECINGTVGAYLYRYLHLTDTSIAPVGGDGFILGFSWGGSNYGAQLYIDCDPTYNISIRQRNGSGEWQSWKQIITENNIGSQSVNYATTAGSAPASDVYAWAKAATKPSYTHNEIGAGDLTIGNGANSIYLRTDGNWATAIYHQTTADEAVMFLNKGLNVSSIDNYTTSWIFAYGNPSDRPAWNSLTPALQIKGRCVAINKLIGSKVGGSYNLDVNGSACVSTSAYFCTSSGSVGIGTTSPSYNLHVVGTFYSSGVATFGGDVLPSSNMAQSLGSDSYRWEHIHGKFIWAKGPAPAVYACNESGNWIALHWASDANRGLYDSNNWIIGYNGTNTFMGGGNVGIGTSSPSYKLHVSGDIYATGGVTSLSDARHKTIMGDTKLRVEQIAEMPAITYKWNDRRDDALHVGSIAQNWQRILPEVVSVANDLEGTLSINYGVAAMIASIVTARKVVDHEARIKALESECERLREENKQLRLKIA